ncbi:MAG: hypothetical protein ABSA77_05460 [Thermoguttaceae bacterium]
MNVNRVAARASLGSVPRKNYPRPRFMPGSGDWGDPRVKLEGRRRGRPSPPYRSSATHRAARETWKSSGLAASCSGSRAVKLQSPLPFLDEHPIIRPLDDYAAVLARKTASDGRL